MPRPARAPGPRYLVVVARFNRAITARLLRGALAEFRARGVPAAAVETVWVPGSFELPIAARTGAATGRYAAVACLGAVLKGETSHDVHVAAAAAAGIERVSADTGVPVTFGVITADTWEQAEARSRVPRGRNLGRGAAAAAVAMAAVCAKLKAGV